MITSASILNSKADYNLSSVNNDTLGQIKITFCGFTSEALLQIYKAEKRTFQALTLEHRTEISLG